MCVQVLGEGIVTVTAQDEDLSKPHNVIKYTITEDSGDVNFMINENTGEIALKRSLLGEETERYEVRYEKDIMSETLKKIKELW